MLRRRTTKEFEVVYQNKTWTDCRETELAYFAGFFDGEGCVCFSGDHLSATVTNTNKASIEYLYEVFGGTMHYHAPQHERQKEAWVWSVNRPSDVTAFLILVQPYVKVKREVVDLGLAIAALKSEHYHKRRSERTELLFETLRAKLQEYNKKGPR